MKKVLKILGILLGVLVLLIGLTAAWVSLTDIPTHEVKELAITVPTDSASVARGQVIVESVCGHCHRSEKGTLEGRQFFPPDAGFGALWSGNITNHPTAGIGKYSDGEIAYLLRTGIKNDGKLAGPFMYYPSLSDEDIGAIIAYLRSDAPTLAASDAVRKSDYSLLAKALMKFGAIGPLPNDGQPVAKPSVTDQIAYGKYLAEPVYDCYACHSANFQTNNPLEPDQSVGYMAGGNLVPNWEWKDIPSRNITPHAEQGIGGWSYEDFVKAVKSGIRPDGSALSDAMPRYALVSEEDMQAMFAYFNSIPAAESNPVLGQ